MSKGGTTNNNNNKGGNSNSETTNPKPRIGGGGTGTNKTGNNVGKILESNLVESPKFVPIEIETEKTGEIPKPKRKYKKRESKKKDESSDNIKDIQNLLEGVFSVVSIKAGEHWKLQSEESEQIAKPLYNILEKHNLLEKVGNVSDGMALVIATISIVIPRILISKMNKPNKKKIEVMKKNGAINGNTNGESKKDNIGEVKLDDGNSKAGIKSNDGKFIKSLSPTIYL